MDQAALVARVRSILRIKELHDTVEDQAKRARQACGGTLRARTAHSRRVSPHRSASSTAWGGCDVSCPRQLAELVISTGDEALLDSHRREIAVVFCDLRGFTAFSEVAEPEEVMAVLADYHGVAVPIIERHGGTLERFLGDGLMVIFNDPLPCPDPVQRAVRLSVALREAVGALCVRWRQSGYQLGFGVGLAHGFATLGRIGAEGRLDYTAIGTVVNQAARLCGEAKAGEILITQRIANVAGSMIETESLGALSLKGLRQPVACYRLLSVRA